MGKINKKEIEILYDLAEKLYNNSNLNIKSEIRLIVEKYNINESSIKYYIESYIKMRAGECYIRTINAKAVDYYLRKIYEKYGKLELQKGIISVEKHIKYYNSIPNGSECRKIMNILKDIEKELVQVETLKEVSATVEMKNEYFEYDRKSEQYKNVSVRNRAARKKCIEHYGNRCAICGFSFEETFGIDIIEVHHRVEISKMKGKHSINPLEDLIPLCSNCHTFIHSKNPCFTLKEVNTLIQKCKRNQK